MGQILSVLGEEMQSCVRKAKLFDDEMDEFDHTLRAVRFRPAASLKMLKIASSSLRFSPNSGAKSYPS